MSAKTLLVVFVVAVVALGAGYYLGVFDKLYPGAGSPSAQQDDQHAGIANPASVNCVTTLGGQLEIADTAEGQVGYCHLKDGRVCEEWGLFRDGSCNVPQ